MQFQLTSQEILLMFFRTGTFDLIFFFKETTFQNSPLILGKIVSFLIRTIKTSLHIIIYNCNFVKAERRGWERSEGVGGGGDVNTIDFEL